jgi:hypothetical protein
MTIGGENALTVQITYYRNLYYLIKNEHVIVCLDCFYNINYEEKFRDFQRLYK